MNTIIIIGGGICGLSIAKELLDAGKNIILIEAKEKTGGRIHTIRDQFSRPVEAGAEFIHGDLPLTKALLKEAGIETIARDGKIYKNPGGKIQTTGDFTDDIKPVLRKLKKLSEDMPFAEFLAQHDFDEETKSAAIRFAEGFDAADTQRISSFSIRDEWAGQKEEDTLQVDGGYGGMVEYLTTHCLIRGCILVLSCEVSEVRWQKNQVSVHASDGKIFNADAAVITVPLGVLLSQPGEKGHITFTPPLLEKEAAAKLMGYGTVIKVMLEFHEVFWSDKKFKDEAAQLDEMNFFVSENYFPTWWAHADHTIPMLTGWIGGPKAEQLKKESNEHILARAIDSLASTLQTTTEFLRGQLKTSSVQNWGVDPYAQGAYSYATVESKRAKKVLTEPVEATLFFAGEALNDGDDSGTVEAALKSAAQTVERIVKQEL